MEPNRLGGFFDVATTRSQVSIGCLAVPVIFCTIFLEYTCVVFCKMCARSIATHVHALQEQPLIHRIKRETDFMYDKMYRIVFFQFLPPRFTARIRTVSHSSIEIKYGDTFSLTPKFAWHFPMWHKHTTSLKMNFAFLEV